MNAEPLDPVRKLIDERVAMLGLDFKGVSKQLPGQDGRGRNESYLHQFVRYGTPKKLDEDDRHALAAILQVDSEMLRPRLTETPAPHTSVVHLTRSFPNEVTDAPHIRLPKGALRQENVPVRGVVRGGTGGSFELNAGDPIEYVRRPVSLTGKGELYALHVESDSMAPRYEPGEIVLVWAQRPALLGRDVVVQLKPEHPGDNPRAYLKRLVKRNDKDLVLNQFNPPLTMTVKMKDVLSVHMVLTRDEMV